MTTQSVSIRAWRREALQTLLLVLVGMHGQGPVLSKECDECMVALPELLAAKLLQRWSTPTRSTLALLCLHNYFMAIANFQHLVADTA